MKKKVTISLDDKVYKQFQKYCEDRGLILSKQIEFFLRNKLEKNEVIK